MSAFVTRFAPSPTGYLHLGHAYSVLLAHDQARAVGGQFFLRIEDIDHTRCRPKFQQAILGDLEWLGVYWDGPVRQQSDHLGDYQRVIEQLDEMGMVYRCFKTRKEILEDIARAPHQPPRNTPDAPAYTGTALPAAEQQALLAAGKPFAWRLSIRAVEEKLNAADTTLAINLEAINGGTPKSIPLNTALVGDVILARKDAGTSYHIASCFDDAVQGITHIIRGEDLADAVHTHRLLQWLMGWPVPVYRHHPLITDADGKRLAKRDQSITLQTLRQEGQTPRAIRQRLGLPV